MVGRIERRSGSRSHSRTVGTYSSWQLWRHCKPLRKDVQELCIDHGPDYRVYLSRQGPTVVVLLCGSDKSNQQEAITRALAYLEDWRERGAS